jgi:hypothetical protein
VHKDYWTNPFALVLTAGKSHSKTYPKRMNKNRNEDENKINIHRVTNKAEFSSAVLVTV